MQVLEVVVAREAGELSLGGGMRVSPADANRPARVLTRTVKDRKFVGDRIVDEFRSNFDVSAEWHMGDLLRVELRQRARKSVRRLALRVDEIIDTHKDSKYVAENEESFSRASI